MSDAMDGLAALGPKADVHRLVQELNTGLNRQLRKEKKRKKLYKQDGFVYYSIVIILLLAIVCYVSVKMFLKN
ncbi:MAG: hypothetical protein EOO03_09860 [Chitinophagaceae bacterium]|nr:MAG: hypothetical protein EOO03_09860 [Chitinophagaceae bacterium]